MDLNQFEGHTPGPWEVYDDWYIKAYGDQGGAHADMKSRGQLAMLLAALRGEG